MTDASGRAARPGRLFGALGWGAMTTLTLVAAVPAAPPEHPIRVAPPARAGVPRHAPVFVTAPATLQPGLLVSRRVAPTTHRRGEASTRSRRGGSFLDELPRPFAELRGFASPLLMPRLRLPRLLTREVAAARDLDTRATPGEPVQVVMSAYCLRGTTRSGTPVRTGIVAADPRVFPMRRRVALFAGGRYLGQFRVEDTGAKIRGTRIDIWTPDCADARRFGMRRGIAAMVAGGG